MPFKQDIRTAMRARRRAMSEAQQLQAAIRLARNLEANRAYRAARHIGVFFAFDGEIDPRVAAEQAWRTHRRTYLPIVPGQGRRRLRFAVYDDGAPMVINRYGIPEPDTPPSRWRNPRTLDVVLVPLVAFDVAGRRVGMGGGHYDRCFDYLLHGHWRRPRLLGVAHDFQRCDVLPADHWDVPLDGVMTDRGWYPAGHEVTMRRRVGP